MSSLWFGYSLNDVHLSWLSTMFSNIFVNNSRFDYGSDMLDIVSSCSESEKTCVVFICTETCVFPMDELKDMIEQTQVLHFSFDRLANPTIVVVIPNERILVANAKFYSCYNKRRKKKKIPKIRFQEQVYEIEWRDGTVT